MADKLFVKLGLVLLFVFSSVATYIYFDNGDVSMSMRLDNDKTTFYQLNENNRTIVTGREFNKLRDGNSNMNRRASDIVREIIMRNETGTYIYRNDKIVVDSQLFNTSEIDSLELYDSIEKRYTPYIRGPSIIDIYKYNGDITDIEMFPIHHYIDIYNGTGFNYQYEVRDLYYSGDTFKLDGKQTEMSFDKNMKVTWWEDYRLGWVYKSGSMYVKSEKIESDYVRFEVKLFDPVIIVNNTANESLEDTTIYEYFPDINYATSDKLYVGPYTGGAEWRSLIKFAMPNLPDNAVNISVSLNLWLDQIRLGPGDVMNIYARRIHNQTWVQEYVTWNNYNTLGASTHYDPYFTVNIHGYPPKLYTLDVTSAFVDERNTGNSNFSLLLNSTVASGSFSFTDNVRFISREVIPDDQDFFLSNTPYLEVLYDVEPIKSFNIYLDGQNNNRKYEAGTEVSVNVYVNNTDGWCMNITPSRFGDAYKCSGSNVYSCYQETANVSTACGGLATGAYNYSLYDGPSLPSFNYVHGYDGDNNTYTMKDSGQDYGYLKINYTKPADAVNTSTWNVKATLGMNKALTEACWEQDPLQLGIFTGLSGNLSCYNGSSWHNMTRQYTEGVLVIFEESMVWNIQNNSHNLSFTLPTKYLEYETFYDGSSTRNINFSSVAWNVANGVLVNNIEPDYTNINDISWNTDGTKYYVIDTTSVYEYSCSTPWDITTGTYSNSLNVQSESADCNVNGLYFTSNGTFMFTSGNYTPSGNSACVVKFECSTPWNIGTCVIKTSSVWNSFHATDLEWKDDGSRLYFTDNVDDLLNQRMCSTPWLQSTCSLSPLVQKSISGKDISDIQFKSDGSEMYLLDYENEEIATYACTDAWNISTCTEGVSTPTIGGAGLGLFFNNNGTRLYETFFNNITQQDIRSNINASIFLYNYDNLSDDLFINMNVTNSIEDLKIYIEDTLKYDFVHDLEGSYEKINIFSDGTDSAELYVGEGRSQTLFYDYTSNFGLPSDANCSFLMSGYSANAEPYTQYDGFVNDDYIGSYDNLEDFSWYLDTFTDTSRESEWYTSYSDTDSSSGKCDGTNNEYEYAGDALVAAQSVSCSFGTKDSSDETDYGRTDTSLTYYDNANINFGDYNYIKLYYVYSVSTTCDGFNTNPYASYSKGDAYANAYIGLRDSDGVVQYFNKYEVETKCTGGHEDKYSWASGSNTYVLNRTGNATTTYKLYSGGVYVKDITIDSNKNYGLYLYSYSNALVRSQGNADSSASNSITYIKFGGIGPRWDTDAYDSTSNFTTTTLHAFSNDIRTAVLDVDDYQPTGSTIKYYVSADDGTTWELIADDGVASFSAGKQNLKFKALLDIGTSTSKIQPHIIDYTLTVPDTMPSNVTVDTNLDGVSDWNMTGDIDASTIYNVSVACSKATPTNINDYCDDYTCEDSPIRISSVTSGFVNISDFRYLNDVSQLDFDADDFNELVTGNPTMINISFIGLDGEIDLSALNFTYTGNGNITLTLYNETTGYNDTKVAQVRYSNYNYSLPDNILAISYYPWAIDAKEVDPFGQTVGIPILNITSLNGVDASDFYFYLNETHTCVDTEYSVNGVDYSGAVSGWQTVKETIDYEDNFGLWLKVNLSCSYDGYLKWNPSYNFRQCCEDCVCSEDV